ncbi:MAG: sigma-70 family RNA polymerase sigma factor [Planctomycetaceae bacterium]|nr:sigma-70 family RNA polymerase sigma factor [Planctomycetaceae bacterium]
MPSKETWEATLNRVLPQALAMAVRVCGNLPAAEDAVQDGLVKLIQSRDSFRGESQLSTWMLHIVLNSCRDWLRKNRPMSQRESGQQTSIVEDLGQNEQVQKSPGPGRATVEFDLDLLPNPSAVDPALVPIQAEEQQLIQHAVTRLPARQREVVQLLIWQGLPASEVAALTATSIQNVYANFHAAKQQLRAILSDQSSLNHNPNL